MKMCVIIVPYRDREEHLRKFTGYMAKYLQLQLKHWEILVIEQEYGKPFNRGRLLNIGFLEAENRFEDFYCIFHDVDMLPINADYRKKQHTTHMAGKASQFNYRLPYPDYFGGVTYFNREDFRKCNGFPNDFWGWGGEDDALLQGVMMAGIKYNREMSKFNSLEHKREVDPNQYEANTQKLKGGRNMKNGLGNCEYDVLSCVEYEGYIHIKVSIC